MLLPFYSSDIFCYIVWDSAFRLNAVWSFHVPKGFIKIYDVEKAYGYWEIFKVEFAISSVLNIIGNERSRICGLTAGKVL